MPTTTRHAIPYPALTAAPNVPADMQAMAGQIDTEINPFVCTSTTRPTPKNGLIIQETDTYNIYIAFGTTWVWIGKAPRQVIPNEVLLGAAPSASSPLIRQTFTKVVDVGNTAGGFNVGLLQAFPNSLCSAQMSLGDNTAHLVVPIIANHTLSSLGGAVYRLNGTGLVPCTTGDRIRLNIDALGW